MSAPPEPVHSGSAAPGGLTVRGLIVRDGNRTLVEGLDLDVAAGQRLVITGPSSADVTAVLATLAGLRPHTGGTIEVDGRRLSTPDPGVIGYLSQDHRLIGTLTAVENLMVSMLAGGGSASRATAERAEQQLEAVALAPATWHNLVEQLSGGQQQRVALSRALVLRPRLLVLDHPTSELDPDSVELVDRLLTAITAEGIVCVLASDDDLVLSSADLRIDIT